MIPSLRLVILVAAGSPLWLLAAAFPQALPIPLAYAAAVLALAAGNMLATPGATRLQAVRTLPLRFSMDAEQAVTVTLTNRSRRRITAEIRDDVPDAFQVTSPPGLLSLEPGGARDALYIVKPVRRGPVKFRKVTCRVRQGLGLVSRQITLKVESERRVYPRFMGIDRYALLAIKDRRDEAIRTARSARGQGSELESLRPYAPGDDPRHIEWKISAKRGSLITRSLQVERGQHVAILIDAGRFMGERLGDRTRFEHAVDAAVMLASVAQKRGDSVSVACFSNRIESFMPMAKGQHVVPRVLEALCDAAPRNVESDYWHAFALVLSRLRKRSLVVLLSEILDRAGSSGLLNNLVRSAGKHLVLSVVLTDEEVRAASEQSPRGLRAAYLKAAAGHIVLERTLALDDMRSKGILVLETTPEHVSVRLINRYLEIRRSNLL